MPRRALLVCLMFLVGCAGDPTHRVVEVSVQSLAGVREDIRSPDECATVGGWWTKVAQEQTEACVVQATDRGKSCIDDSECQSFCEALPGAVIGADATGECSSGLVGTCDVLHVRDHQARRTCVE